MDIQENKTYCVTPLTIMINRLILEQDEKLTILKTNTRHTTFKRLTNNQTYVVPTSALKGLLKETLKKDINMNIKSLTVLKPNAITINVDDSLYDTAEKLIAYWRQSGYIEKEKITFQNCHDQNNDKHLTIALYSLYPQDAKEKLIELFTKELEYNTYTVNGVRKISQYWDYNEHIPTSDIQNIFNNYNHELTFEENVINYAWEHDWFSEDIEFPYYWSKFVSKYPEYDLEEFENILSTWFYNSIEIEHNIESLIRNSEPDDLTLYFGTNWDDDYLTESSWQEYEGERLTTIDLEQFINDVKDTQLAWLIQTQGYKLIDVFNKDKWKDSKFLQSVHSELYDYVSDLKGTQLIAIPDSTNWEAIVDLKFNKTGIIKAGTSFGLFNRIHGSGSGLCITTEKDIILNNAENLYDVQIQRINQPYNYSPDAVYGLGRTSAEQLEVLYEIPSKYIKK